MTEKCTAGPRFGAGNAEKASRHQPPDSILTVGRVAELHLHVRRPGHGDLNTCATRTDALYLGPCRLDLDVVSQFRYALLRDVPLVRQFLSDGGGRTHRALPVVVKRQLGRLTQ